MLCAYALSVVSWNLHGLDSWLDKIHNWRNKCSLWVFVDRKIRYEALQSEAGKKLLRRSGRAPDDISSVVLVEKDRYSWYANLNTRTRSLRIHEFLGFQIKEQPDRENKFAIMSHEMVSDWYWLLSDGIKWELAIFLYFWSTCTSRVCWTRILMLDAGMCPRVEYV